MTVNRLIRNGKIRTGYSDEKLKMFFSELDLPYMIKSESAKGKRITKACSTEINFQNFDKHGIIKI